MMTMYQSLLMGLVSLLFYVLEIWGLKKKVSLTAVLSTHTLSYSSALSESLKVLNGDFLMSATQQLIILTC